ncbi:twin-arginine translocase TatA/TatE family subunit [Caldithrix abyssi]
MNFGFTEILIIAFIVLLLFGGKKIPQLARSLGSSLQSFKKGIEDAEEKEDRN